MKVEQITNNVYRFTLMPLLNWQVYSYLINTKDHIYVIDTGCGVDDATFINNFIEENNFNKPITIINTHYHYDHIWGNNFINYSEIISSKRTYNKIINTWEKEIESNSQHMQGEVKLNVATVTFENILNIDHSQLYLFESKGHTDDGICIYYAKDKILFVGDNIGDDDTNIIPELECSKEEYIDALNEMLRWDIKFILSGHNNIKTKDFLHTILNLLTKK